MAYQILSGNIQSDVIYQVVGMQSVTYNSIAYATGQRFRGIIGIKTFTYSGTGTQDVNEVLELVGGGIEFSENSIDQPSFPEVTLLNGMSIEFTLNNAEKIVKDITVIQGFALELIDYPSYSFEIIENKL